MTTTGTVEAGVTTPRTTEPRTRPRKRRPGPFGVLAGSLATFLVVLAFLSFQLAAGHDPALGQGATAPTAPERPAKRQVVRRIKRRVIVKVPAPSAPVAAAPAPSAAAPVPTAPAAPAAPAAPVTPAPAPAPPPAPVTRSS